MAKLSFGAYPHMLGFEQLEQLLERAAKSSNDGYPPFNIEYKLLIDHSALVWQLLAFQKETYLSFWKIASLLFNGVTKKSRNIAVHRKIFTDNVHRRGIATIPI